MASLLPAAAPRALSQHTLVSLGNTGTGLNKLLLVSWCLLWQGVRTWRKQLELNKKTNLRNMKTKWSSQYPVRTWNNSPPMEKTTITAERTHFSYLSSSLLPIKQSKQAHLHRWSDSHLPQAGQGSVNPPGPSTSAQCNGELTSNAQQISLLAYASSTIHKYKPEIGKFSSPLTAQIQIITQDMSYAHIADSQVFSFVPEDVYIKWVQFCPSPLHMVEHSSAFIGFVALHWTHSSKSISSLYWGHQNW